METKKFIKLFLNDMFILSKEGSFESFFYKSKIHVMINLLIASESLSGEKICQNLCPNYGSRSTILGILKSGIKQGHFEKYTLENNRKDKLYKLSNTSVKKMDKWVQRQFDIAKN